MMMAIEKLVVAALAIGVTCSLAGCDVLDDDAADGGVECEGAECAADSGATGGGGGAADDPVGGDDGAGGDVDEPVGGSGDSGGTGGDVDEPVGGSGGTGGTFEEPVGGSGGADEGTGGAGGAPVEATYSWIELSDLSVIENGQGTPGADICGVAVECGEEPVASVSVALEAGTGAVCSEVNPPECSAVRDDPAAAMDDGMSCDAESAPSDYVSVGVGGRLWFDFGQDLRGCTVTVVELEGRDDEPYEVRVCADATRDDCLDDGVPVALSAEGGGALTIAVPAAE